MTMLLGASMTSGRWTPPAPNTPEWDDAGNVVAATDWLGNQFRVGDQVMYCISAGRGQMMAIGKVLKFKNTVEDRVVYREALPDETPNYVNQYTGLSFVRLTVQYDCITVQVLTLRTSGRWDNETRSKPAWVNPMNITALPSIGVTV